jgi:hypothetical protein
MTLGFAEFVVDDAVLGRPDGLTSGILHGPDIVAGEPAAERTNALEGGA